MPDFREEKNKTGAVPAENISGQDYERMKHLTELLNRASEAYYNKDTEIMSNLEYDRLYDELSALETRTGIVLAGSPTVHVGYTAAEELPKERHARLNHVYFKFVEQASILCCCQSLCNSFSSVGCNCSSGKIIKILCAIYCVVKAICLTIC